jgi:hypothetical protein
MIVRQVAGALKLEPYLQPYPYMSVYVCVCMYTYIYIYKIIAYL